MGVLVISYIYVDGSIQYINGSSSYISASSSESIYGCLDLGYISSSTEVRFIQYAYGSSSSNRVSMSVYLQLGPEYEVGSAGIRYEGSNPNNYLWYNNELWRIIGVFDENTHGVAGENLVKIIRVNMLDGYVWDSSGLNDWTNSSLNNLLNKYYYYGLDGTSSGYCYGNSTTVTKTCDFSLIGLNIISREMVENVTWYLGGSSVFRKNSYDFFVYERGGYYVYDGNSISTTGNIGLIYASDYGYSVLSTSCERTTDLYSYNKESCAGQSWIFRTMDSGYEYIITSYSDDNAYIFLLNEYGNIINSNIYTYHGLSVRPTLYLKSSVYVISGSGTMSDPYIIAY